jgi:hypothetical protein
MWLVCRALTTCCVLTAVFCMCRVTTHHAEKLHRTHHMQAKQQQHKNDLHMACSYMFCLSCADRMLRADCSVLHV